MHIIQKYFPNSVHMFENPPQFVKYIYPPPSDLTEAEFDFMLGNAVFDKLYIGRTISALHEVSMVGVNDSEPDMPHVMIAYNKWERLKIHTKEQFDKRDRQ